MSLFKRLPRHLLVALPIVGFWLTMMTLLWHRELGGASTTAPARTAIDSPSDAWFAVFLAGGQRVGYLHYRQAPEQRAGEAGGKLELDARVVLELMGKATELEISGSAWRANTVAKAVFDFRLATGGYEIAVDGRIADGELQAQLHSMDEVTPLRLPFDGSFLIAEGLGSALRLPVLEVGEEHRLANFDPLTLRTGRSRVRCVARETLVLAGERIDTRVLVVEGGGVSSRAWVDGEGRVVRAETPFGLVLEKSSPETATAEVNAVAFNPNPTGRDGEPFLAAALGAGAILIFDRQWAELR
ncbi:MAG: hypothetical protein HC897_18940, partial [Thermoanaerobaculia bacterium]|nr:hypothetical protein [Thermoanaerobaculia bacterium]